VFLDLRSHSLHAQPPLAWAHFESCPDRLSYLLYIVWIHQQRISQFLRRSGKSAQYQHPVAIVARGQILLRYQIHTVMQRGNKANVGLHCRSIRITGFQPDASNLRLMRSTVSCTWMRNPA
jgi:hypothetical protein